MTTNVARSQNGFTLIEITIVLAVIAIIMAIIVPTIGGFINQSRNIKVRRDLEIIGLTVARLMADTGQPCLKRDSTLFSLKQTGLTYLKARGRM